MSHQISRKNRPSWRLPIYPKRGKDDAVFKCQRSRFGDGHPSRRQCEAKARSTGERCRHDAVQAANCCHVHGGLRWGREAAERHFGRERVISLAGARNRRRDALAKLGLSEEIPRGLPQPISPVQRGLLLEAFQNRLLAPGEWKVILTLTEKYRPKR